MMVSMLTAIGQQKSFKSSDLSRNSTQVFAAAEDEPVEVTRRDGEDLVLMSKLESDAREKLLQLAATLIGVATDTRGTLAKRMADALPWMLALSPTDQDACANDLLNAARASFSTGQAHLAVAELNSWLETATAVAAGLGTAPVEWLDEDIIVERP